METVFVLRVCSPDLTSHKGFQWPSTIGAKVSAPDWSDNAECGNGLHGWLHGAGDTSVAEHTNNPDAKWLCLEVDEDTIVDLNGKVKFPMAIVRFVGDRKGAAQWIVDHDPLANPSTVIGHCATAGDGGTATAGYRGTATAGYGGTATAGAYGTATAGYGGTATAGEYGTATAGDGGTATAGDRGTATAGDGGTATAGQYGTATAGDCGTATAGNGGEIRIRYIDCGRYRTALGYVGEAGILPNVPYRCNEQGELIECTP